MFKLLFLLVKILALCAMLINCHGFKKSFEYESKNGNFKFSTYYNQTNDKGDVRLRKVTVKQSLSTPFSRESATFKFSLLEELISCSDLPTFLQNQQRMLGCQPLSYYASDTYNFNDSDDTKYLMSYVNKLRFQHKLFGKERVDRCMLYSYPMEDKFARKEIKSIIERSNLNDLNFNKQFSKETGLFIFVNLNENHLPFTITCKGKVFLSVNATENLLDDSSLDFSEFIWFSEGIDNGFLLNFQDLSCAISDLELFSIKTDLTIIKRQEFPYITVHHNSKTSPIEQLFKYTGTVKQTTQEQDTLTPNSYKTIIQMESQSVMPFLDFMLTQTFVNKDTETGYEIMALTNPSTNLLVVGEWNEKVYNKTFQLTSATENLKVTEINGIKYTLGKLISQLQFMSSAQDEFYNLNLVIRKDLFDWIKPKLHEVFKTEEPLPIETSSRNEL